MEDEGAEGGDEAENTGVQSLSAPESTEQQLIKKKKKMLILPPIMKNA